MEYVKLDLKKRNRAYGILTWRLNQDFEIKTLLQKSRTVNVEFSGKVYSNRKVDYKYRRIAFGKKRMENIKNDYVMLYMINGNLVVK